MTKAPNSTRSLIAKIAVIGYLLITAFLSFMHIVSVLQYIGSSWQAYLGPVLIDGMALIGKLYDTKGFTASTRKLGRITVYVAGTLSLICNIASGLLDHHYGDSIIGVIAVVGFMWGEKLIAMATPTRVAPARARTRKAPAKKAPAAKKTATAPKATPATRPTLVPAAA